MPPDLRDAVRLHEAGQIDRAVAMYGELLLAEPNHADALHLLGVALHQKGDAVRAIEHINRAIAVSPSSAVYHGNLGEIYRGLGQFERAIDHLRTALRLDPESAEAANSLGIVSNAQGKREEAIALFERALEIQPRFALAHNNLGNAYRLRGEKNQAAVHFQMAIDIVPDLAEAQSNLGQLLLELERPEEALRHCREAVRLGPQLPEAHNNLGNVLRELGRLDEAKQCYREALRLSPQLGMTFNNMAQALQDEGRLAEAREWYEQAILRDPTSARIRSNFGSALAADESLAEARIQFELALQFDPTCPDAHLGLAGLQQEEGRLADAIQGAREAIRLKPDFAAAHSALGAMLEELGQLDEAQTSYREAIRHSPRNAAAYSQLATLLKSRLPAAELSAMESLLKYSAESPPRLTALHFGLAQVFDARGEHRQAAEHLRQANNLRGIDWARRGQAYDPADHEQFVDRLIAIFTPEFLAARRDIGNGSQRPVFIVGLPRSGTTLVEQILASHSQVFGAGELRLARLGFESLPQLLGRTDSPIDCLAGLDRETIRHLAQKHLDGLARLDAQSPRVVDKMPDNYLYLGLLMLMFPHGRFIHTRRDVRDVAVSCWMTNFKQIRWACSPEHIASRFANYRRLMEHWDRVLPMRMLPVDYEETVRDLEGVARRLVSWCGLEWEDRCLAFHQSSRPVRTASVTQVRQPIYTRSVERWRNYETDLGQLFMKLMGHA
jgi:tetratricopeptide (TPR) repeat protein